MSRKYTMQHAAQPQEFIFHHQYITEGIKGCEIFQMLAMTRKIHEQIYFVKDIF